MRLTNNFSFPVAQQPKSGLGRLLLEITRSHSDTPHFVGFLWTSDQPVEQTSTWQYTNTHKRKNIHAPGGIRYHDTSNLSAEFPRLKRRGHWDRRVSNTVEQYYSAEANISTSGQEISRILWSPNVYCSKKFSKSSSRVSTWQIDSIYGLQAYFFKIGVTAGLPLILHLPSGLYTSRFPTKIL
jgi:hypothetical protein